MLSFQTSQNESRNRIKDTFIVFFILLFMNSIIGYLIITIAIGSGNTSQYSTMPIDKQIIFNWIIIILFSMNWIILADTIFLRPKKFKLLSPQEWLLKTKSSKSISPTKFVIGIAQFSKKFELTTNMFFQGGKFKNHNSEKKFLVSIILAMILASFPLLQIKNFFSYTTIVNIYEPAIIFISGIVSILLFYYFLFRIKSQNEISWKFEKKDEMTVTCTIFNPNKKVVEITLNQTFFSNLIVHEQKLYEIYPEKKNLTSLNQISTWTLQMQIINILNNNQSSNDMYTLFINRRRELVEQIKAVFDLWLSIPLEKSLQ